MSGLMPMMPIRLATTGSNVLPRTNAASAFPEVAARRNSNRAETTSPSLKKSLPRLSSIEISSSVSATAPTEIDIVPDAWPEVTEVTMDVRKFDGGSDSGLPAASAVSGFEFGAPRSATLMNGGGVAVADCISAGLTFFAISIRKSRDCLGSFTFSRTPMCWSSPRPLRSVCTAQVSAH
jgi:hypothetical protein